MNKRFYNFGGFRLDTHNQRLLRSGEAITLTLKQFELLLALVENAGDVVSKDQLFERVWRDVAVADETLTRNISWLRQKLGDGGEQKFIETVPKRGYRFAAEVTATDQPEILVEETTLTRVRVEETLIFDGANDSVAPLAANKDEITPPQLTDAETSALEQHEREDAGNSIQFAPHSAAAPPRYRRRNTASRWLFGALALIAAASISLLIYQNYFEPINAKVRMAANFRPFSGVQGREDTPAFSPDGKQLAFSWNGGTRDNSDIYIQIIGAGEPVRLTDTEVQEQYPVFSPDGTHIAFVREYADYGEVILIPALGGAERRVARLFSGNFSISFAPDGASIAVVDAADESGKQFAVFALDLKTGERRRLTAAAEFTGETTPRFSPDGKSLAFVRVFPEFAQDLYVVSTDGAMNEPVRLTADKRTINSLAWSADGSEIFFVSQRESNRMNIWRISAAGGAAEIFSTAGDYLTNIAASPDGKTLAFVGRTHHSDLYRMTFGGAAAEPLIATSFFEDMPDFSSDGRHIAFRSNRSDSSEAWIGDADGKNLRQLTGENRHVGVVRFSPDAAQIAFHANKDESKDIFVASVESGKSRRLTDNPAYDSYPAWSADGKNIYFTSDRTGENNIWRVPANGGDAVQITRGGGAEPLASADGKWIYYTKKGSGAELHRISAAATAESSDETPVSQVNAANFQNIWTLTKSGVYFVTQTGKSAAEIKFFEFSTERVSKIAETDRLKASGSAGIAVAPDGKSIVFAQFDQDASNIMLAEIDR